MALSEECVIAPELIQHSWNFPRSNYSGFSAFVDDAIVSKLFSHPLMHALKKYKLDHDDVEEGEYEMYKGVPFVPDWGQVCVNQCKPDLENPFFLKSK